LEIENERERGSCEDLYGTGRARPVVGGRGEFMKRLGLRRNWPLQGEENLGPNSASALRPAPSGPNFSRRGTPELPHSDPRLSSSCCSSCSVFLAISCHSRSFNITNCSAISFNSRPLACCFEIVPSSEIGPYICLVPCAALHNLSPLSAALLVEIVHISS